MANIRVSYSISAALVATTSVVAINLAAVGGATATVHATPVIKATAFVVPTSTLENQTVLMSDFRALNIGQVSIDIATATDDVAISFDTSFEDSVTATDTINRMFYGNIDFDPTDPDADPDPITMADTDAKSVGKTLTDASAVSEADVKSVGKVSADSVSSVDAVNTKHVGKSLTNEVTTNDAINIFDTAKVVADSATATDAAAKELTRPNVADSVTAADTSFTSPGLGKTDSVTAADTFGPFDIGVNPSDAATTTDAINTFAVAKVLADEVSITDFIAKTPGYEFDFDTVDADADPDPVTMSEVMAKDFTRPDITDTATASDAAAKEFTRPDVADSVTPTETTAKSVTRPLADAATMADALATTPGKVLADATIGATDTLVTSPVKAAADSVTGTDAINVFVVAKVLADAATVTENLVLNLILGQSSPLYDFAFASDDKFTYFPVPGTINSHLIHQPLVNGEFVLTTDPNAGIVYTIRTESDSYMFAGYGLNENQLN